MPKPTKRQLVERANEYARLVTEAYWLNQPSKAAIRFDREQGWLAGYAAAQADARRAAKHAAGRGRKA